LDVLTVHGSGASPSTLARAELAKADLLVGVTSSDEVNILACTLARNAGVRHRVARVSNADFFMATPFFTLADMGVDLAINPRRECADEIVHMLQIPGTREVVDMLGGRVLTVGLHLPENSPLAGLRLGECPDPGRLERVRLIAHMRKGLFAIPHGETDFLAGDELYITGTPRDAADFVSWASPGVTPIERAVIAGGGGLGLTIAARLEKVGLKVVVIEQNHEQAQVCSALLTKGLVLQGNTMSRDTLNEAGFSGQTAFVAATGDDENNIISCLLAKQCGAPFTIAQVSHPEYVPVINSLHLLNRAVSTHLSLINSILHFTRGRHVKAASLLHSLPGELLELTVQPTNPWVGKAVSRLKMPRDAIIATVLRDGEVVPPTGALVLQPGDGLILFASPKSVARLKEIFH
jgi:trk system potassium uptake protein